MIYDLSDTCIILSPDLAAFFKGLHFHRLTGKYQRSKASCNPFTSDMLLIAASVLTWREWNASLNSPQRPWVRYVTIISQSYNHVVVAPWVISRQWVECRFRQKLTSAKMEYLRSTSSHQACFTPRIHDMLDLIGLFFVWFTHKYTKLIGSHEFN